MSDLGSQEGKPVQGALLLSIGEACRVLGLSRTTLYAEMTSGRLRSVTVGRRRLIPRDAIDAFIAGLPTDYRRPA